MIDLDRISFSTARNIVELLRDNDIAKVRWSYIWYDDQADPDEIEFYDVDGNQIVGMAWVENAIEHDLYELCSEFGDYELNAYTGRYEHIGGEPWRVPKSAGGAGRCDFYVDAIDFDDLPEDEESEDDDDEG